MIPNVAEKNILILVEEKKNNLILSHKLMLKFWKKISRLAQQKKINIPTLVLSEKKIRNETKNLNPPSPFKLNGRSLRSAIYLAIVIIEKSSVVVFFKTDNPYIFCTRMNIY